MFNDNVILKEVYINNIHVEDEEKKLEEIKRLFENPITEEDMIKSLNLHSQLNEQKLNIFRNNEPENYKRYKTNLNCLGTMPHDKSLDYISSIEGLYTNGIPFTN